MARAGKQYYIVSSKKAEEFVQDYEGIKNQKIDICDEQFRQGVLLGMQMAMENLLGIRNEHPQDLSPLDAHENTHK